MRSNAWPEAAVAVIAACSLEAGWITLLYIAVTALATHAAGPVPLVAFAIAAFVGLGVSRRIGEDRDERDRTLLAAIAIAAAIAGWLLPLGLDAGRVVDQPYALLQQHAGGLLLGLAVLRGSTHVTEQDDERIAEAALGPGVAFVAVIWVVLSVAGATADPVILGDAYAATVTFVTAALLSMGLARIGGLRTTDDGPAGRHAWVGLLVALIAGLTIVAIPLALVIGAPVDAAVRGVLGPIAAVLVPVVAVLVLPGALIGAGLVALIEWLRGSAGGTGPVLNVPDQLAPDAGNLLGPSGAQAVVLGLVPLVLALIVVFVIARTFLSRTGRIRADDDAPEIRELEGPAGGFRLPRPRRPRPRHSSVPRTATEAYLASLELLASTPEVGRLASETPREHAHRIGWDPTWLSLRRLAVDYTLAEFGNRSLTAAEHRRAVDTWRRLDAILRGGRRAKP